MPHDGKFEPVRWQDFVRWEPPPSEIILGDYNSKLLVTPSKGILYGRGKSYKTMLGMRLATSVSTGSSWLGFSTLSGGCNVLYLNAELPGELIHERVVQMNTGLQLGENNLWIWNKHDFRLDNDLGFQLLADFVDKHKIKLIVIDPLYKIVSHDLREESTVRSVTNNIDRLITDYRVSVFLVAHPRKASSEQEHSDLTEESLYGSGIWLWWADTVIRADRGRSELDNRKEIKVSFDMTRLASVDIEPVRYQLRDDDLQFVSDIIIFDRSKAKSG